MITKEAIRKKLVTSDIKIRFSDRELDCIEGLFKGKTMKGIASVFKISPRTVETHLRNIKWKLKCNYKSEIIDFFLSF